VRIVTPDTQGVALVLSDLSELQRLGRARRDFIANLSHELRTPIASIRLLVESLLSGAAHTPEESNNLLTKIVTHVQALEQMAQELLDLAQIESGQAIVRLVPTSAAQIVQTSVDRLRPQAEQKQLRVHLEVADTLTVLADPDLIQRVIGNLLHNAIKFSNAEGEIWIRAHAQADEVHFEVADNGPGLAAADVPRVFERFFRADRSRAKGGTGLGLAIAKHVVEAHGGHISVESPGPGHGATFKFTLLAAGK
jgi:two-component system phosphate regulon sensor histidine kinase PhoR